MKSGTLNESVYQYILEQILSGKHHPGDKIPEAKIAEEFGTSRTPIREALRRPSPTMGSSTSTPSA